MFTFAGTRVCSDLGSTNQLNLLHLLLQIGVVIFKSSRGRDTRVRHSKRQHYFSIHLIFQHNKSSTKFLRLSTTWCSNTNTWATITKTSFPSILAWLSSQPFMQLSISPHISIIFHNLFILRELTVRENQSQRFCLCLWVNILPSGKQSPVRLKGPSKIYIYCSSQLNTFLAYIVWVFIYISKPHETKEKGDAHWRNVQGSQWSAHPSPAHLSQHLPPPPQGEPARLPRAACLPTCTSHCHPILQMVAVK